MTISEFSNGFDTLLSSYAQQRIYGLAEIPADYAFDEYEKSLFLTEAQKIIIREIYDNPNGTSSFESEEKNRRALESLVKQQDYTCGSPNPGTVLKDQFIHTVYDLNKDCWYIVYEQMTFKSDNKCINGTTAEIIPIKHDDYTRTKNNPFRGPGNRKSLRLDKGNFQIEIVSKYPIDTYTLRYMSMPEPIILVPLEERLAIDGKVDPQTCKLHSSLHEIILTRAVQMALESKINSQKTNNSN